VKIYKNLNFLNFEELKETLKPSSSQKRKKFPRPFLIFAQLDEMEFFPLSIWKVEGSSIHFIEFEFKN